VNALTYDHVNPNSPVGHSLYQSDRKDQDTRHASSDEQSPHGEFGRGRADSGDRHTDGQEEEESVPR